MSPEEFSIIASTIPKEPGIYKYFSASNELLYVGKAKHLAKRVSSYFQKTNHSYKTIELVKRIKRIEFAITNNEHEALLLENSLIKEFQPKYNISLKDDKTYPYIVIKNEPFPRVFFTRRKFNDSSTYYGPYTSVQETKELIYFIKQNIALRTCKLNLSAKNIKAKKYKVCLEYHLGNCKGPCENLQTEQDYADDLFQLANLLKGNYSSVSQHFKQEMQTHAANMEFEKAQMYKRKLELLQSYKVKNTVVNIKTNIVDVFSIVEEGDATYVNYLAVNEGAIINTKTIWIEKKLEETTEEVLQFAITELRNEYKSEAKEIILPFDVNFALPDIIITVPKAGEKKKLLELSQKNADYFKYDIAKRKLLKLEEKSSAQKIEVLHQIKELLHLREVPLHIECFDNSNFQGTNPVSAIVVFKNGQPSRADYRRFKVKTVEGINDFATMSEAVLRRYKRLLMEQQPLPQLVIIDGGKGQLSAAMQSVKALNLPSSVTFVGLAKNEEEIFFPGDSESFKLPWDSDALKLIRRIRDEVHEHGITFHRDLRSKNAFNNELEQVPGIGPNTVKELLTQYKSLANIANRSAEDLAMVVGKRRANIIINYFTQKKNSNLD